MSHDERLRCHVKSGYDEAIKNKLKNSDVPGNLLQA